MSERRPWGKGSRIDKDDRSGALLSLRSNAGRIYWLGENGVAENYTLGTRNRDQDCKLQKVAGNAHARVQYRTMASISKGARIGKTQVKIYSAAARTLPS